MLVTMIARGMRHGVRSWGPMPCVVRGCRRRYLGKGATFHPLLSHGIL